MKEGDDPKRVDYIDLLVQVEENKIQVYTLFAPNFSRLKMSERSLE